MSRGREEKRKRKTDRHSKRDEKKGRKREVNRITKYSGSSLEKCEHRPVKGTWERRFQPWRVVELDN